MKMWLAALTLFAVLSTNAQAATVAGTVVDARTQHPVAGASVTITLASGAPPLRFTTDADGRFSVETNETPASVSLNRFGFESYTMSLVAMAPSAVADLRIALNARLVIIIERLYTHSACAAFQPREMWDRYALVPGGCGMPKN